VFLASATRFFGGLVEAALLWLFGLWWLAALLVHPITALLALSHFRRRPVVPSGPLPPVSVLVLPPLGASLQLSLLAYIMILLKHLGVFMLP